MKKSKPIVRFVHCSLFNADVTLVVCQHEDFLKEAKKFLQKEKYESLEKMVEKRGKDDSCLATQFPFEDGASIIWARPKLGFGTLVHEVVHAAHHLLECRDIPLSDDTEEVYAYLIEFLFNGFISKPLV